MTAATDSTPFTPIKLTANCRATHPSAFRARVDKKNILFLKNVFFSRTPVSDPVIVGRTDAVQSVATRRIHCHRQCVLKYCSCQIEGRLRYCVSPSP